MCSPTHHGQNLIPIVQLVLDLGNHLPGITSSKLVIRCPVGCLRLYYEPNQKEKFRTMKASVIVPAYNSEKTLPDCLQAVRQSGYSDYELVVVDDGSTDGTERIAKQFADRVIRHEKNISRIEARNSGIKAALGDILIFIDSDVVIQPQSLEIIVDFFENHPAINVVTGLLSKTHPNDDFFSQYKNLYMNYIFSRLPDRVSFLFGSVFAARREVIENMVKGFDKGEDTAMGQELVRRGESIAFIRKLEVIHLKKYSFLSWLKNDFEIPFNWIRIFLFYDGWKQLGKKKVGFAHSPKEQLMSVILAPVIVVLAASSFLLPASGFFALSLAFLWLLLNSSFISFLFREKGLLFGMTSIAVTFIDHLVMFAGIISGTLQSAVRWLAKGTVA